MSETDMSAKNNNKEIKCVIWDLDNTIWNGTLLEDEDVTLKPGMVDILKELDNRGIIQSIASKNNYAPTIEKLKELDIEQYFIYPEINWNAKSQSLENIHLRLNIGLDTFLFIDDQEFERQEVQSALQDVQCLDAAEYNNLLTMPRLNPKIKTKDSKRRRELYLIDLSRKEDEQKYEGTPIDFLKSINLVMSIHKVTKDDLPRVEELLIRTNRLNATKRIYNYEQLERMLNSEKYSMYVFELSDKYGTYGYAGTALIEHKDEYWYIFQLAVSCRVISRGAAEAFLSYIIQKAAKEKKSLKADYIKTDKNKQMYIILRQVNFKDEKLINTNHVVLNRNISELPELPEYIEIKD